MSRYVDRIVTTIHDAEEALSEDVRDQQQRWQYSLHRGRVWFDKEGGTRRSNSSRGSRRFSGTEASSTCSRRRSFIP